MAKVPADETIWVKGGEESSIPLDDEDVWDDTELIRLYDKSIAKLKNKTNTDSQAGSEKDNGKKKKKKKKSKTTPRWQVGDGCLALYHLDNLYYEATILSLNNDARVATVRFSYYLNEEEVDIKDLLRPELKSKMEVCERTRLDGNDRHLADVIPDVKSPDIKSNVTNTSDEDEHVEYDGQWRVSDLCYVLSRKGVYHRAVINSFIGGDRCVVTFTKSNTKGHAKLSQLHRKMPREHKRTRSRTSSSPSELPNIPWSFPGLSNTELPPLPPMPASLGLPPFPTVSNNNSSWKNLFPPGLSFSGTTTAPPPCPAPPVIGGDVLAGSEEALANMLMSWYISGFHTGYYQGKQQQQPQPQQPQPQSQPQPTQSFMPPPAPLPLSSFYRSRADRKKSKRHHDKPKVSNV